MHPVLRVVFLLPLLLAAWASAQSAADLATLADLKTASHQMQLESEGVPPFRLSATLQTFDFLGRPDNQGSWTEEFSRPLYVHRVVRDSNAPENYAPEDQETIGFAATATSGTFIQRLLVEAFLHPGPSDALLANSKITYKQQKIGDVSLRCVIFEPIDKPKDTYLRRTASRAYCLSADSPLVRMAQLGYGIVVTYNSIAKYGGRTFAQQITAQQRGHVRGKLQVAKVIAVPELLHADFPKQEEPQDIDTEHSGATKIGSSVIAGSILSKVQPVYPEDAKRKHISGTVVLHAVISKTGGIESLEVMSAPSDDLAEAAVDAVSQWRYKPYTVDGKATEVDTTVTVHFMFG